MARRPCVTAALAGLAVVVFTACAATTEEPPSPRLLRPTHVAPAGWHGIGFHGIGLDVPDTVTLFDGPWCPGPLPGGDLVVPVFDAGATSCPAASVPVPSPSPRPATELTVVLTGSAAPSALPMAADARTRVVSAVGVTVRASGPADVVDTVLDSARVASPDPNGCDTAVDPAVAPRPRDPDGRDLLPVATRRVVVCEYGTTAPPSEGDTTPPSPFWLVASRVLPDDVAVAVDRRLRDATRAPAGSAVTTAPSGPVLRLLVVGVDGETRVLQSPADVYPQTVTDGHLTVRTGPTAAGSHDPLPTPFDRS